MLAEPYHAVVYFAPEVGDAYEAAGLRGFWRGYFAGRAAPLGAVGAGPVVAAFYGFHPDFVSRALPSIWSLTTPERALEARLAGVDAALRNCFEVEESQGDLEEATDLLRRLTERCRPEGRPLFAANADLPWPAEPHLALWHAATLVREYRGDGHVAALLAAGLDACEAHVTLVAASGASPDTIAPYRGWTDGDWRDATARLQDRGWIDDGGQLTPKGWRGRADVEAATDRLALPAAPGLDADRLIERLASAVRPVVESGVIPYPNAMGVPALGCAPSRRPPGAGDRCQPRHRCGFGGGARPPRRRRGGEWPR